MDDQKLHLIRGKRIAQQIEGLVETTTTDLQSNIERGFPATKARQHATNPVQIGDVQYIAYQPNRMLKVESTARSNGHIYNPTILFQEVEFTEDGNGTTFRGVDGEHTITPIQLNQSNVKVRCTCLDFYHRFSKHNQNDDSLLGNPMPPYQRKPGSNRPPVNPMRVPGVCKHLLKLVQRLQSLRIVT